MNIKTPNFFIQAAKLLTGVLLLSTITTYSQFYSGSQMEFGKNRVQYKDYQWLYYDYDKYQVYFYEGGKELAAYVAFSAKKNMDEIERTLDYPLDEKIQFVVYNKQSEFAQSNIGYVTDEPYNTGGVTRIVGTKVIIYNEGDHAKLDMQIRSGIAEILINQMMYGGKLRDMLKNSTLLTLPDWFQQGAVSFTANRWSVDVDNRVKDGIISGKFNKFNHLTGVDAINAGHSIWYYISETYGDAVIPNLLYMVKVTRNVESAFLFVLGVSMKNLTNDWLEFYRGRYIEGEKGKIDPVQIPIIKKPKEVRVFEHLKLSPDGNKIIYVTNELSQQKVWLYDLTTNKKKRIFKAGHKIDRVNDYSYPLLAWHPSGKLFAMITEVKGKIMLTTYELESKEKITRRIIDFEKVLDFSYSPDGQKFAMSAVQKGQSDIFIFTVASNGYERVTQDIYDDLNPRFVHGGREVIFASNRIDDTLRSETKHSHEYKLLNHNKDLFIYNYQSRSRLLRRLSNTPDINESNPADFDSTYYSFLSDENGIKNRFIAYIDSTIDYVDTASHYRYFVSKTPITNYSRNILEQDVNIKCGKYSEIIFSKGKYFMYINNLPKTSALGPLQLQETEYRRYQEKLENLKEENNKQLYDSLAPNPPVQVIQSPTKNEPLKPGEIDINNYTFENQSATSPKKKDKPAPTAVVTTSDTTNTNGKKKEPGFKLGLTSNYYVNYSTDYVVTQLDNTFINTTYQKFTGGGSPIYLNPGFTGLFKIGLSDLFDDYKIVAAMRLSGDLNNNEYFISYEDRLKLYDKQVVFHRQSFLNVQGSSSLVKVFTHDAKYVLKRPFSEVLGLRGTLTIRNDRTVFLATDVSNLEKKDGYDTWGGAKLELVFDNTRKRGLNLFFGTRLKVFAEYFRQVDEKESGLYVVGFDVRHYQKIHRDFIWANRIAGSTSFGQEKLVYYMGGVDNWFTPKFDRSIDVATNQNYAYQTLATNMRGFFQNIRNGNSFVAINSELRMPLFRYLLNRPIRSDFISNFQLIGFFDAGTAWTGNSPYSEENSLNKIYLGNIGNPITIILNNNKEPIIAGYGWGMRSRVFGYFIRTDWAWGIEDGIVLPRIFYLSFSLDF